MTTIKTIAQYLGYTEEEFYNEYVALYMRWLLHFAPNEYDGLQALMANTAVNKWYTERHADLQRHAMDVLKVQAGRTAVNKKRQMYNVIMVDIFANYPKPLFDAALKLKIENHHDPRAN